MQKIVNYLFRNPEFFISFRNKLQDNFKSEIKIIKKYVRPNSKSKILDFGCGTGDFCKTFRKSQYTGVDIEKSLIDYANSHFKGHNFILLKKNKPLPFKKFYFDKIISVGVFHHISDRDLKKILEELKKILKNSGQIILIDQLHHTQQKKLLGKIMVKYDRGDYVRKRNHLKSILTKKFIIKEDYDIYSGPFTLCVFILKK